MTWRCSCGYTNTLSHDKMVETCKGCGKLHPTFDSMVALMADSTAEAISAGKAVRYVA